MPHGKNTSVFVNEYELTTYYNNADIAQTQELAENTMFQASGSAKTFEVGLNGGTVSLQGKYDGGAAAAETVTAAAFTNASNVTTICPENDDTIGNACKLVDGQISNHQVSSPLAGIVTISTGMQATGRIARGVVLHPLGAETVTGNSASVDNSASSANGGVGHVHVTTSSAGAHTLKVQDSPDDAIWADLVTFTNVTGATSERLEVTGTVDRYTRANFTIGGGSPTCTFMMAFARY